MSCTLKLELRAIKSDLSPVIPGAVLRVYPTGEIAGVEYNQHWIGAAFLQDHFTESEIHHIQNKAEEMIFELEKIKKQGVTYT